MATNIPKGIRLAAEQAEYSCHPTAWMGAVVLDGKLFKGGGYNQLKTHPKAGTYGNFLHAELDCLLHMERHQAEGCTLYVARVKKSGGHGNSKPCEVCWAAAIEAGIKEIVWFDEEKGGWVSWVQ